MKAVLLKRLEVIKFIMMSPKLPSMVTPGPCPTTFSAVTVTLYLLPQQIPFKISCVILLVILCIILPSDDVRL